MSSVQPEPVRTAVRKCDADRCCSHAVCFRAAVKMGDGRGVARHIDVCAGHLTDVITMLMSWASEHHLGNAKVTVHAIAPECDRDGDAAPLSPESVQVTTLPVPA